MPLLCMRRTSRRRHTRCRAKSRPARLSVCSVALGQALDDVNARVRVDNAADFVHFQGESEASGKKGYRAGKRK